MFDDPFPEASHLFRKAAEVINSGDNETGAQLLKAGYATIDEHRYFEYFTPWQFIRLATVLCDLNRNDEAWSWLNKLLLLSTHRDRELVPMHQFEIYKKMSVIAKGEGRHDLALRLYALSYTSWLQGLKRQKRRSELNSDASMSVVHEKLKPYAKRAEKLQVLRRVCDAVRTFVHDRDQDQIAELAREIDGIIAETPKP